MKKGDEKYMEDEEPDVFEKRRQERNKVLDLYLKCIFFLS